MMLKDTSFIDEHISRFIDNINRRNPKETMACHNVYFLQTTDVYGNVTGEAYGINLMTNYGFSDIFINNRDTYLNLYIGDGTEMPTVDNKALFSPIVTTASTVIDHTKYRYPLRYDKENGIVTGVVRPYVGYFDYNLTNITEPREITEFGYGISHTNLYTHARVYDVDGNLSSITKNPNERLTIWVYWAISHRKELIEQAYDKGVYIFIDPTWFLTDRYISNRYVYLASEAVDDRNIDPRYTNKFTSGYYHSFAGNATAIDSNTIKSSITPSSLLFENKYDHMTYFVYGDYKGNGYGGSYNTNKFATSRFFIITHERLKDPEEIVSEIVYTNSYDSSYLTYAFGKNRDSGGNESRGSIPASKFDIQSLTMYNHITKEWDIEEVYDNDPNTEYSSRIMRIAGDMYMSFDGKDQSVRIFINTNPDIPITGFTNTGITLYATDAYWDTDTWEQIHTLSNVPTELQSKRYWIKVNGNDQGLNVVRDMVLHKIHVQREAFLTNITQNTSDINLVKPLSSNDNGWLMTKDKLVYLNDDGSTVSYAMKASSDVSPHQRYRWNTDDRILLLQYGTNINDLGRKLRIYTVGNDPAVPPTSVDMVLDFSTTLTHQNVYSFCDNGYFVAQRVGGVNEAVIVDFYNVDDDGNPIQYRLDNVYGCHGLNRSTNCVYVVPGTNRYEIYDMKNRTVIDTFEIPEEYQFQVISGWSDFIYVRTVNDGTYSVFLYNMRKKNLSKLSVDIPIFNMFNSTSSYDSPSRICLSVDECMIVGGLADTETKILKESDPENPISICPQNIASNSLYSLPCNNLHNAQLQYTNGGKQLILTTSYYHSYVVDIGYILDHGPLTFYPGDHYPYYGDQSWRQDYITAGIVDNGMWCVDSYGKLYWYPIENLLPHKVVGVTDIIQSYNNPKKLQNKCYTLTITNDTTKL